MRSSENDLLFGNLKLAEDRLLPYMLCNTRQCKVRWVPHATYWVDPVLDLRSFYLQRRRWNNATTCYFLHFFANQRWSLTQLLRNVSICLLFITACESLLLPALVASLLYP